MDKFNWIVVVLGAMGAIAAIFIKEIAQTALKRQMLIGQLDAYTRHWAIQFFRNPGAYKIYKAVEDREKQRSTARLQGVQALAAQMAAQDEASKEARAAVKEELSKAASEGGLLKDPDLVTVFGLGADSLAVMRQYLMDNKTFLSDGDAAQCGPAIAHCVVNFRGSAFQAISALESLIKAAEKFNEKDHPGGFAAASGYIIDTVAVEGEQFLASLIRLERLLKRARQRNLVQHCWDIVRGW